MGIILSFGLGYAVCAHKQQIKEWVASFLEWCDRTL